MLDIKFIRDNTERVKEAIKNKNEKDRIDEILSLDKKRRAILQEAEELKAERNRVTQEIARLKKAGQNADEIIIRMRNVSDEIKIFDEKERGISDKLNELLAWVPNVPHKSVPIGRTADDNVEIRRWLPEGFSFEKGDKKLDHLQLGKKFGILDFERGAKISGSGFPVYIGKGAGLERALINFMLDYHLNKHGYTEVFPPFLVNRKRPVKYRN